MTLAAASLFGGPTEMASPVLAGPRWEFVERDDLGTVQIVAADRAPDTLARLGADLGPLPATGGTARLGGDAIIVGLSPRWWLIQCRRAAEIEWIAQIASAFPDGSVLPTTLGDHLPWFDLVGQEAEGMLAAGALLEIGGAPFLPGMSRRMLIARVPVVVLRLERTAWRLGIERSRAGYFRDWLAARANNSGASP